MRSLSILLICCLTMLMISSCSSRQLGYRYAETLISWQAGNYVSLTDQQDAILREETDKFLQWHAETQMPNYHQLLNDIYRLLQTPEIEPEAIAGYSDEMLVYWQEIRAQLIAPSIRLLQSLDDEQVSELLANMQNRLDEQHERLQNAEAEIAEGNDMYPQQRRASRFIDSFRNYGGRPNNTQEEKINDWSMQAPIVNRQWYAYQQDWHNAFASALEQRNSNDFAEILADLFMNPEQFRSAEMNEKLAISNEKSLLLMVKLHESLTNRQRTRLTRQVDRLRRDFRGMMEQRNVEL
ncbi:hypothetical protein A28LD_0826 [Idiomarina sp. A28L]|uniref:DUF6279 family lipoprotein n=1 Tax=Idiomarina sp. A28L TaxID=1036674 RepID=UPI000213890B|nr:DUF6279 family lipoprotein [Idiomarina sp. A28L]EGN75776.1 hypothetical protein A28LD_0826 [Idiomarina sp. A28L]